MLRRCLQRLKLQQASGHEAYSKWPWPMKFTLKENWWHDLSVFTPIRHDMKCVACKGDTIVLLFSLFAFYQVYDHFCSGRYQTRLCHLTNYPPALVAQDFDFGDTSKNRKVTRAKLDDYRKEYADARKQRLPVEEIIFKY